MTIMRLITTSLLVLLAASVHAGGTFVDYRIDNADYQGYYISPADNAPLILLVHDWDGLGDYEIRRARMLADKGYAVFAVDMFGRGIRPLEISERQRLTGALYQDRKQMRRLLEGALMAANDQGAQLTNAVAMGYCFGGTVVLELARSGADLKGFVSFHGGLATPEGQSYATTRGSVLVLHGSADTAVSMADFAQLTTELEAHDIPHEMITYSGAPHAFTLFDSDRYRADADRKSWDRFLGYLQETLD